MIGLAASGCAETANLTADTYLVEPQDTLYSIAWRHGLDFRDLARWNGVGADYHISVGQTLKLRPPIGAATPAITQPPVTAKSGLWRWPTEHLSPPRAVPGGGILLLGKIGQEIHAAAAGRVVYAGSGIRGYGNLIILKHGDSLLSAYAHNRDMLVHEGREVRAGEAIARMGEGPQRAAVLYFEIRLNGKPVDPLGYLPK